MVKLDKNRLNRNKSATPQKEFNLADLKDDEEKSMIFNIKSLNKDSISESLDNSDNSNN